MLYEEQLKMDIRSRSVILFCESSGYLVSGTLRLKQMKRIANMYYRILYMQLHKSVTATVAVSIFNPVTYPIAAS